MMLPSVPRYFCTFQLNPRLIPRRRSSSQCVIFLRLARTGNVDSEIDVLPTLHDSGFLVLYGRLMYIQSVLFSMDNIPVLCCTVVGVFYQGAAIPIVQTKCLMPSLVN